jgi:K(+)-stimulated pyrophosphate-energized sodium pump
MNILIKLTSIVALIIAPHIIEGEAHSSNIDEIDSQKEITFDENLSESIDETTVNITDVQ